MAWKSDYEARRTFDPERGLELTAGSCGPEHQEYLISQIGGAPVIRFSAPVRGIEIYDPPLQRDGLEIIERFARDVRDISAAPDFESEKRQIIMEALVAHQGAWGIDTFKDGVTPLYADVEVHFID